MKDYHFSCGDSTWGSVGVAGSVRARGRAEALRKVRRALSEAAGPFGEIPVRSSLGSVGYVNIYVAPENIRVRDIDAGNGD